MNEDCTQRNEEVSCSAVEAPFGIAKPVFGRSFVVLDKSFLDAVSSAQLRYYAQTGITFGVTDVLMYELMRKRDDDQRTRSLFKLSDVQELVLLPGVGEMFREEGETRKPASSVLKARRPKITPDSESSEPFPLTPSEMRAVERRTVDLKNKRVPGIIEIWRELGSMPELKGVCQTDIPEKLTLLELEILNDRESMRKFYANHAPPPFPPSSLIDERWACFRWIQVYLLAGVDIFVGMACIPSRTGKR